MSEASVKKALKDMLNSATKEELGAAEWWLGRYIYELDLAVEDGDYKPEFMFVDESTSSTRKSELEKRSRSLHLGMAALRARRGG